MHKKSRHAEFAVFHVQRHGRVVTSQFADNTCGTNGASFVGKSDRLIFVNYPRNEKQLLQKTQPKIFFQSSDTNQDFTMPAKTKTTTTAANLLDSENRF